MKSLNIDLNWLPSKTARTVTAFATDIDQALGDRLECLALTGSVVSGDYVEGVSDINSAVVLSSIDTAALEALAELGKRHGRSNVNAPLVLSAASIVTSLDVFPIEFLEIRLAHRIVLGSYDFGALSFEKSHLRLELERELKARLINLRQGFVRAAGDAKILSALLLSAYKGFFPLLRSCIYLNGGEPPLKRSEALKAASEVSNLDFSCFAELENLAAMRRPKLKANEAAALFAKLYETTNALAIQVDHNLA